MTFRTGDRAETLWSGELVVLESAIQHEVEALEESACLLTLGAASWETKEGPAYFARARR